MSEIEICQASADDALSIQKIYAPYVAKTAITFEYEVPSVDEFKRRILDTLARYPYLVAKKDGRVVGYAYAGVFYARAAYDWTCELSVYVDAAYRHQHIGQKLYDALEKILRGMHITNLYACITAVKEGDDDPHITDNSVRFHQHLGFSVCGHFRDCGYKFNHWYDMVYMVKMIGAHTPRPMAVLTYPQYLEEKNNR